MVIDIQNYKNYQEKVMNVLVIQIFVSDYIIDDKNISGGKSTETVTFDEVQDSLEKEFGVRSNAIITLIHKKKRRLVNFSFFEVTFCFHRFLKLFG